MCIRICVFCLKKKTHTIKKISTSKFIRTNLQHIKDRALCFLAKKSAVGVVFLSVSFILKIQLN